MNKEKLLKIWFNTEPKTWTDFFPSEDALFQASTNLQEIVLKNKLSKYAYYGIYYIPVQDDDVIEVPIRVLAKLIKLGVYAKKYTLRPKQKTRLKQDARYVWVLNELFMKGEKTQ